MFFADCKTWNLKYLSLLLYKSICKKPRQETAGLQWFGGKNEARTGISNPLQHCSLNYDLKN